jgi:hypothetical protein
MTLDTTYLLRVAEKLALFHGRRTGEEGRNGEIQEEVP